MIRHNDGELFYATCLANGKLRSALHSHIKDVKFQSKLAQDVVNFFLDEQRIGRVYVPTEMKAALLAEYIDEEINYVLKQCASFAMMSEQSTLDSVLEGFKSFFDSERFSRIVQENKEDPSEIIRKLSQIRDISFSAVPVDRLGDLDPKTTKREDLGDEDRFLPTACDTVRRSFVSGKYAAGLIVLVCAAPGVGKSLWGAGEVLEFLKAGFKGYWLALGDLLRWHHLVRFTALAKDITLNESELQLEHYFDDEVRQYTRNLRVTCVPSSQLDSYQIRHAVEVQIAEEEDLDFIVIDYDLNVARGNGNSMESLYLGGEHLYNIIGRLARPIGRKPRLVMVMTQPKTLQWDSDRITMAMTGSESSRKPHAVDFIITLGKHPDIRNETAGVISVVKNRHGIANEEDFYVRTDKGRFKLIDEVYYNRLLPPQSQRSSNSQRWRR